MGYNGRRTDMMSALVRVRLKGEQLPARTAHIPRRETCAKHIVITGTNPLRVYCKKEVNDYVRFYCHRF